MVAMKAPRAGNAPASSSSVSGLSVHNAIARKLTATIQRSTCGVSHCAASAPSQPASAWLSSVATRMPATIGHGLRIAGREQQREQLGLVADLGERDGAGGDRRGQQRQVDWETSISRLRGRAIEGRKQTPRRPARVRRRLPSVLPCAIGHDGRRVRHGLPAKCVDARPRVYGWATPRRRKCADCSRSVPGTLASGFHRTTAMQYRRLGSSGLQLSALSFGAWVTFGAQIGRGEARELIAAAWDHGINFFDNAEGYANGEAERVMGDVIADLRLPRDGYCVSSKVFFGAAKNPRADPEGPVAQARHRRLPRRAEAPARGLPRPVFLPPPRSGHADRGNRVGDGCADPPGQGAVLGHLGMVGAADPRGPQDRARRTTCMRRRWSSRNTTCCTASASSWNTRRCTPNSAWARPSGRRWRRAC